MFERVVSLPLSFLFVALSWSAVAHAARVTGARSAVDEALLSVYGQPAQRLLWSDDGRPTRQALELCDLLSDAGAYGLRPADYAADELAARRRQLMAAASTGAGAGAGAADLAAFDQLASRAALGLIHDLHFGRIDPRTAGFEIKESRLPLDLAATLTRLAPAPKIADSLAGFEPQFQHYRLLKAALARYRALAADPDLTNLPPSGQKTLHPGDAYADAPLARKLLTALGDLPTSTAVPDGDDRQRLDGPLVEALKHFQSRHGLTPEGSLGPQTYAALTTPLAHRVRQIELTLERWRWLPTFDTPPIIVNIPQFRLFAFRTVEDRAADIMQMDVIVGQTYPRTRTPVFVGDMKYVIFRPYWDVPRSITLHEMLPQIARHANYLQHNNLELVRGESDESPVVAATPASIAELAAGRLRLRQKPGDDNALGLIKFMFPNNHNVYMHSTPAHRLFLQSRRAFSHGCIRVSDPEALAAFVLRNAAGDWDAQKIQAAMQSGRNSSRVPLTKPIRVMILYATAQATEAGPVQFFDDIYGHDRHLESLLALEKDHGTNAAHRAMIGP